MDLGRRAMADLGLSGARPSEAFWRGQSVFLTGHTGFKGGWLAALLHRLGARTTGFALAPEPGPTLFEAARTEGLVHRSVIGDIRDGEALAAAMAAAAPRIVLHLAAQALVRRGRDEPDLTFDTNVMGTVRLLEAVRRTPSVEAVVVVTSDKVYDNREWPWAYRESDALGGKEAYGASKAASEIVLQAYRHSYLETADRRVAAASARAGNVIGGGDWAIDRLVPDAVRAFTAGQPLVIRNPSAVRPWQHVLEPLTGYLRLAEDLCEGLALGEPAALNFGPAAEDARDVASVADALAARWGQGASWTRDPGVQPYEARLLEVDSAKARTLLGWRPMWGLDEGLDRTIAWYRAVHEGQDARAVTLDQIEAHLNG
jgi:CDP-glucose 4,6-dehydratase